MVACFWRGARSQTPRTFILICEAVLLAVPPMFIFVRSLFPNVGWHDRVSYSDDYSKRMLLLLWPPAAVRGALLALAPLLSPVALPGAFFQPRCAPCGPWSFWGCLSCFSWARQLSSPPCLTSREREGAEKEERRTREGAEQGQKGVEKQ